MSYLLHYKPQVTSHQSTVIKILIQSTKHCKTIQQRGKRKKSNNYPAKAFCTTPACGPGPLFIPGRPGWSYIRAAPDSSPACWLLHSRVSLLLLLPRTLKSGPKAKQLRDGIEVTQKSKIPIKRANKPQRYELTCLIENDLCSERTHVVSFTNKFLFWRVLLKSFTFSHSVWLKDFPGRFVYTIIMFQGLYPLLWHNHSGSGWLSPVIHSTLTGPSK